MNNTEDRDENNGKYEKTLKFWGERKHILEKSFKYDQKILDIKKVTLPEAAAIDLDQWGIKTIPLKPWSDQLIHGYTLVDSIFYDVDKISSDFIGMNIGIVLGEQSQNLFAIKCHNEASYCTLREKLVNISPWVIKFNDEYYLILCSLDGKIGNKKGVLIGSDLIGRGYVVIPPSIFRVGSVEWLEKNSEFPPSLDKAEIAKIMPLAKVISARDNSKGIPHVEILKTPQVIKIAAWGQNYQWQSYKSCLPQVWKILCLRADIEDVGRFRATLREIAGLAQINKGTASTMLTYLVQLGLLDCLEKNNGGYYKFSDKVLEGVQNADINIDEIDVSITLLWDDTFAWGAINASGKNVYLELLKNSHRTKSKLSLECGIAWPTAHRALERLMMFGLVVHDNEHGYSGIRCGPDHFKKIAEFFQTTGSISRKEKVDALQRENYHGKRLSWAVKTLREKK